jgi:hypothetical protein
MASNINTSGLDDLYPVAGVDNDSQGFRDNFANIKTNLGHAATEITALQNGVARVDGNNDFNGNEIYDANLRAVTQEVNNSFATSVPANPIDPAQTQVSLSFDQGSVYIVTAVTELLQINPIEFPTNRYASMRLILGNAGITDTQITIDAGSGIIKTDDNAAWTQNILTLAAGDISVKTVIDIFSYDGGNNLHAAYVGTFTAVP